MVYEHLLPVTNCVQIEYSWQCSYSGAYLPLARHYNQCVLGLYNAI